MSFSGIDSILDFLKPISKSEISNDEGFKKGQLGNEIDAYENNFPDIENADLILVGCDEKRGENLPQNKFNAADEIRKEFYRLFKWHDEIKIADAGNINIGAALSDTYAAVKTVLHQLSQDGKKVLLLGGSHDLMLAQYKAFAADEKIIEVSCADAFINIDTESHLPAENFLMQLLTEEPNFVKHYNHIGFQSYLVHPAMLETIDKLRFDCFRAGKVKENIEEMEPVIRNSNLFSFDISCIQNAHAPANILTPNGFTGEEACALMQYAGMSHNLSSISVCGYLPALDKNNLTAKQIAQMAWYLLDGMQKGKQESKLAEKQSFNEYHLAFAEMESVFLQSKKTGRWWMQLPGGKFTACSYNDYVIASQNEIPERWMRAVERSV